MGDRAGGDFERFLRLRLDRECSRAAREVRRLMLFDECASVFGTPMARAFLTLLEALAAPSLSAEWRTAVLDVAGLGSATRRGRPAPVSADVRASWAAGRDRWRPPIRDVDEIPWGVFTARWFMREREGRDA